MTLFWSARGVRQAQIYRLSQTGERTLVWNVDPAGTLPVQTSFRDRGQIDFLLIAGEGAEQVEQQLSVPLVCPVEWFFQPPPEECADSEAEETFLIEQEFERGRMVYVGTSNLIYVLFNDGFDPAWAVYENRYDPNVHPEREETFPGLQPIARLGFVWRSNETVRNRLGVAQEPELRYEGFVQTATRSGVGETLYISSTGGSVLQLLPGGSAWQIISVE